MKLSAIRRNSIVQILVIAGSYLAAFLLSAIIGRLLGPADLGAWSATSAAASIILGFTALGVDSPVARRMAVEPRRASEWLGYGIGIRLCLSLPLSCAMIVLVTMLGNQGIVSPLFAAIYALYVGFSSMTGLLCRGCQVAHKFYWQFIPLLIGTLPSLVIAYLFVTQGGGLLQLVMCTALGQMSSSLMLAKVMKKVVDPRPRYQWQAWKSILLESWPLAVSTPFLAAYSRVDSVMLFNMQGAESVGFYSAAYGFFMAFCGLASGVQSAIFPVLAKSYAENPIFAYRIFKKSLRWMLTLAFLGIAGTSVLGRWVLVLVYGDSYAVAAPTLELLMVSSVFLLLNNTYGMTLNAIGRQKSAMFVTFSGLFVNIFANIILIPHFNFEGAAMATLITELFVLIIIHLCLIPKWGKDLGGFVI